MRRIEAHDVVWETMEEKKKDKKDDGYEIFGGNAVLREVIQNADGTLSRKFVDELLPALDATVQLDYKHDTSSTIISNTIAFNSPYGLSSGYFDNIPADCNITMDIEPAVDIDEYGLYLRGEARGENSYTLGFSAGEGTVRLGNTSISGVEGLTSKIKLHIIMKGDIIDVSVNNKRCIVNRLPEHKGNMLWLFAKYGKAKFSNVKISLIKE